MKKNLCELDESGDNKEKNLLLDLDERSGNIE